MIDILSDLDILEKVEQKQKRYIYPPNFIQMQQDNPNVSITDIKKTVRCGCA